MRTSEMIAKHLAKTPGEEAGVCAICGVETTEGTKRQKVISSSFTDWAQLRFPGKVICPNCAACLGKTAFDGKALRSYSVMVTESGLSKASRKEIVDAILNPPQSPYMLIVNYSQKKHAWFSAKINDPISDVVLIGTDQGEVVVHRWLFRSAFMAGMDLYAGGFSKADIELGNTVKYNKIEQYGVDKYYTDMAALDMLRNTKTMQLLIWALYKDQEESDDQN
jgi:hypothetical protein